MKLCDIIINNLQFKTKKNNSLISSLEKLKYQDLLIMTDIIDNPKFLNEFSSGWNAAHYSVINPNLEVLFFISNLYIKNNCDLNQPIERAKNSTPLGNNTLDIAIHNQKLDQFLVLKSFNISQHNSFSYFLSKQKRHYSNHEEDQKNIDYQLPCEFSIANLFLFGNDSPGLRLLNKNMVYDEKTQIIQDFLNNHIYICEHYITDPVFNSYDNFFESIIKNKNEIDINCFDFFAIPFIHIYDIKKEKMDYQFFKNFYNLYLDNPLDFFDNFSHSKYKDKMISTFISMNELIQNNDKNTKEIKKFFNTYQIDKLIFSLKLSEKLSEKLVHKSEVTKINKI